MLLGQWRVFPEASLLDTGTEVAVRSVAIRIPYLWALRALSRRVTRLLGMSSRFPKRRLQWVWVHLLPPAAGTAAACDRAPPARLAPPRGRGWPGAERRMDVREGVPAARNHRSQGRRHHADSHGTRRQLATFLIRSCAVSTITATFERQIHIRRRDRPLARQGQVDVRQTTGQIMSLSAVQRMRPERDEIIVCTGVKIAGSGIQYWGSAAGPVRGAQAQGALNGLPLGDVPLATGRPDVLRQDYDRGRKNRAYPVVTHTHYM